MGSVAESWQRPTRWLREHPVAADAMFGVALSALAIILHVSGPDFADAERPMRDPAWWTFVPLVAASLPVLARRIHPAATLAAVTAAQMSCELLEIFGAGWLGVLVAIYSLGAHTDGRRRTIAAVGVGVPVVLLMLAGVLDGELSAAQAIASLGLFTAAFVLGDNMRRRRLHVESLAERAERAERERDLVARERVAEERNRIARELHDIVAHSVSVIVLQAGAARRQVRLDQETSIELLVNIETTGRRTMDELRQVLGVLRDPTGDHGTTPLPTLADIDELVAAQRDLPVRLEVRGPPEQVPDGIALSAYRIVQEALTNTRRHGGPDVRVDVRILCEPDVVEVLVDDDGRGGAAEASSADDGDGDSDGGGYGLLGMAERVGAVGGSLHTGPRPSGGWRVRARLPVTGSPTVVDAAAAPAASAAASSALVS